MNFAKSSTDTFMGSLEDEQHSHLPKMMLSNKHSTKKKHEIKRSKKTIKGARRKTNIVELQNQKLKRKGLRITKKTRFV